MAPKTSRTVAESASANAAAAGVAESVTREKSLSSSLNPRTTVYEWGGPVGAFLCVLLLPTVVVVINSLCGFRNPGCEISQFWNPTVPDFIVPGARPPPVSQVIKDAWNVNFHFIEDSMPMVPFAAVLLLCWYGFHCIFYLVWPLGGRGPGMELRNGKRLNYHFNALWSMIVAYIIVFGGHYLNYWSVTALVTLFTPLMIASILLALLFSFMLYVGSYRAGGSGKLTALGGNSGNLFYDFWVGRELNPRFGELDFKWVFELRPGLIGWTILCWAFTVSRFEQIIRQHGYPKNGLQEWFSDERYSVFAPLLGATLTNFFYVIDALYFEPGNVTMMDIVHDGFGFMLCFGDIAWVPFLYTLQAKFLYLFPQSKISVPWLALSSAVYVAGYLLFRRSNSQKDRFRKDPSDPRVAHLRTLTTKRGTSLIISSWWGICRHPNYVGDWLMVVGTSLFTGGAYLLPWFQPVYFAILLIHRQLRDEEWMLKKYGKEDWEAYCKEVPYRLIPYIY